MYVVYRVSGPKADSVYYGYCRFDSSPAAAFAKQTETKDYTRADVKFVAYQGDCLRDLSYEALNTLEYESAALQQRNKYRRTDDRSAVGPSNWPPQAWVVKGNKPAQQMCKFLTRCANAREALGAGMWKYSAIQAIGMLFGRKAVATDLDQLSPRQFHQKYFDEDMLLI